MYRLGVIMKRVLTVFLLACATMVPAMADDLSNPTVDPGSFLVRIELLQSGTQTYQSCCKTCRKGKACGNSCISKAKSCRVGQGCACDG